jgi:methyl-accepting chemotaxis protein
MILLRNSLSIRLLVPVLTLVLVVAATTTVVLAMLEANRVRSEATTSIERQSRALQSLFAVTLSIMRERVQSSMRLLHQQGKTLGVASVGPQISMPGRQVNDLLCFLDQVMISFVSPPMSGKTMEHVPSALNWTRKDV